MWFDFILLIFYKYSLIMICKIQDYSLLTKQIALANNCKYEYVCIFIYREP